MLIHNYILPYHTLLCIEFNSVFAIYLSSLYNLGSNLTQNTPHIDIVTEQPSFTEERTGEMSASVCEDNEKLQLMHPMRAASTPNTDGQSNSDADYKYKF